MMMRSLPAPALLVLGLSMAPPVAGPLQASPCLEGQACPCVCKGTPRAVCSLGCRGAAGQLGDRLVLLGEAASGVDAAASRPAVDREGVHAQAQTLIGHYGTATRALGKVINARGGDGPTTNVAEMQADRAEIEALLGPVSDTRLRDLDHYLNTYSAQENTLGIEEDDWWTTRVLKTLGKSVNAVGQSVVTIGYSGAKWFDQTTGADVGSVFGQNFHGDKASRASWAEVGHGLQGAWVGAYDQTPVRN